MLEAGVGGLEEEEGEEEGEGLFWGLCWLWFPSNSPHESLPPGARWDPLPGGPLRVAVEGDCPPPVLPGILDPGHTQEVSAGSGEACPGQGQGLHCPRLRHWPASPLPAAGSPLSGLVPGGQGAELALLCLPPRHPCPQPQSVSVTPGPRCDPGRAALALPARSPGTPHRVSASLPPFPRLLREPSWADAEMLSGASGAQQCSGDTCDDHFQGDRCVISWVVGSRRSGQRPCVRAAWPLWSDQQDGAVGAPGRGLRSVKAPRAPSDISPPALASDG